jgi:hypothetical protein
VARQLSRSALVVVSQSRVFVWHPLGTLFETKATGTVLCGRTDGAFKQMAPQAPRPVGPR